jgi:hypothetical protein
MDQGAAVLHGQEVSSQFQVLAANAPKGPAESTSVDHVAAGPEWERPSGLSKPNLTRCRPTGAVTTVT